MKKALIFTLFCFLIYFCGCSCGPEDGSSADSDTGSVSQTEDSFFSSPEGSDEASSGQTAAGKTDDEIILAYHDFVKQSFKGLEIYCWDSGDGVFCGLLPGTNRVKTDADFIYLYQNPATPEQMAKVLANVDKEQTYVFLYPMSSGDGAAVSAVRNALSVLKLDELHLISELSDGRVKKTVTVHACVTEDWMGFEDEGGAEFSVSFSLPSFWERDNETDETTTTFSNLRNGIKIAEVLPVVLLKEGQSPLDTENTDGELTVLEKKAFTAGSHSGVYQVEETTPSGGNVSVWYPHTYWISEGDKAFGITFYSLDNSSSDRELFLELVATARLTEK